MTTHGSPASPAPTTARQRPRQRRLWPWALGIVFTGVIGMGLGVWWTMIHMPGVSSQGPLPASDDSLRSLDKELRQDVTALAVTIGERNLRNRPEELGRAARYLQTELTAAGYVVRRQVVETPDGSCCNLEAETLGTERPGEIVVVGAHYDTARGAPGANDNTSGVAAVLALARRFAHRKTARTVRFVAFTNEEPPYFRTSRMGSSVYARRCRQRNEDLKAVIILETIGYYDDRPGSQHYPPPLSLLYPSRGNFIGMIGNFASRDLVRRSVATFRRSEPFPCEGAALPESVPGVDLSDQRSFWREGYPGLMVTDTAMNRYPFYHTLQDTIDKVDFDRTARVVRGLEAVLVDLAAR